MKTTDAERLHKQDQYAVSVIIPVYKLNSTEKLGYFDELLMSLLANCKAATLFWIKELIVVHDSPGESNVEAILKLLTKFDRVARIRFLENRKNAGQSYSRNQGALQTEGNYLHFIDQDDKLDPNFYGALSNANRLNADLIIGDCRSLSNPSKSFYKAYTRWWIRKNNSVNRLKLLFINNICNSPGQLIIKKTKFKEVDGFPDLRNRGSDDFAFFLKLLRFDHTYSFTAEAKFYYRIHMSQASNVLNMHASESEAFDCLDATIRARMRLVERVKLSSLYIPIRVVLYKMLFNSFK